MTTKNLVILAGVAVVLGGAAWWTTAGKRMKTPSLVGRTIVPAFTAADVAKVEIGGEKKVTLVAAADGWKVESLYGYPADVTKIRENILKLQDLKVGQVATGKKIEKPTTVALKNAAGKDVATISLGDAHMGKPRGQMAMMGMGGGYPDGRYVAFDGKVVLVKDALDAFNGDPKKWIDTRICAVPSADVTSVSYLKNGASLKLARKDGTWTLDGLGPKEELDTSKTYSLDSALAYLDLTGVADPKLSDADLGLTTGSVYTATLKNGLTYVATVGAATGSDRWVKLAATFKATGTNTVENAKFAQTAKDFNAKTGKWTFSVSSYAAESLAKSRTDLVKAKEEPKKDDAKKDEAQPAAK